MGNRHDLDNLLEIFKVALDKDIVTGNEVLLDDEIRMDVNEVTYNALKKILE